jgi:hypothetical protein
VPVRDELDRVDVGELLPEERHEPPQEIADRGGGDAAPLLDGNRMGRGQGEGPRRRVDSWTGFPARTKPGMRL